MFLMAAALALFLQLRRAKNHQFPRNLGGQEADVFMAMVKPFEEKTGIKVELESTRDLDAVNHHEGGGRQSSGYRGTSGPGKLVELAQGGKLIELSKILDMKEFDKNYSSGWKTLGTVNGKLYGVFMKAAIKGLSGTIR
jgi:alpha-glucoside transport system substrate-binding protein